MKKGIVFVGLAVSSLLFTTSLSSCFNRKNGTSAKTGVSYNNQFNGGFEVSSKFDSKPGPGLIAIEGGTFVMGGSLDQDLTYENDNTKRRVTVASFYMDETEVSNVDWLEYLYWIRKNFPNEPEYYYNALPDTLVWRRPLSYNEPYVNNYLRHPAFSTYPVVGVSWEQANEYCAWRTDRVNEHILRSKGYLTDYKTSSTKGDSVLPFNTAIYLNGQYRGEGIDGKNMKKDLSTGTGADRREAPTRPVRLEDGILKEPYRLPTEAEWEYAALSLAGNTLRGTIKTGKVYPWNGLGVRSANKKTMGLMMANFKQSEGNNMGVSSYLNDNAALTAPVKSYAPNDFGLYNMAGNVNEWTADVYRKLSYEEFEDFNPFRGNVYVDKELTDRQKGLYAKDKFGRPVTKQAASAKKQTWKDYQAGANDSTFNADKRGVDQTGSNDRAEELYGTTTLVNNKSRVYKGGSWNDRAYWLNPATRRYMQQDESSAEIGFRCAMTLVGSQQIISNTERLQKKLK